VHVKFQDRKTPTPKDGLPRTSLDTSSLAPVESPPPLGRPWRLEALDPDAERARVDALARLLATPPGARSRSLRELVLRSFPRRLLTVRLKHTTRPTVLLTFDDGPNPRTTPAVLDCLERYRARAIFFVVGRFVRAAPGLVREILKRGHLVGNHTHLHHNRRHVERSPSFRFYWKDARRCQEMVLAATGMEPRLFRPPGGRITPATLLVPLVLGMRCVQWSLDSNDWRFRTSDEVRTGAKALLARVASRDIVLLHDNRPTAVELLETLLPVLTARGFDLASGVDAL
jgi:peptidoglycan/xylan/chitin deacetylase (PgdA/CDA1 family)